MIVSHKHQFVFLHIPKTAGTTIETALGLRGIGRTLKPHIVGQTKHHVVPKAIPPGYFTFTFVRNPWDRMLSYYMFRTKDGDKARIDTKEKTMTFIEWLRDLDNIENKNSVFAIAAQNQIDIVQDLPDFIGRFENLEADFGFVHKQIFGREKRFWQRQLPHNNPTNSKQQHYTTYYNDEARELVAKRFSKDINHFGYTFEDVPVCDHV